MNWKMFWQIVLLIVIAVVVSSALRLGMFHCKRGKRIHKMLEKPSHKSLQK